jgi:hypothetical protein
VREQFYYPQCGKKMPKENFISAEDSIIWKDNTIHFKSEKSKLKVFVWKEGKVIETTAV